ncbi:MAG: hypothetical protein ABIH27_03585 [Candidatus Omnitrophota bacterium]
MKNNIIFLLTILLIAGCGCPLPKDKKVLAKINNYEIGLDEFQAQFLASPYSKDNTPETRKGFLKMLIGRKLILQDAQAKGLDKENDFLKMIERFWEQSLLKLALDRKSQEIAGSVGVKDNKPGQDQLMNDWMNRLEKDAKISVDYDLLK